MVNKIHKSLNKKKKNSTDNNKNSSDNNTLFLIIKILIWPFKIVYKILYWIVKGVILGIEKIISLFHKQESVSHQSKIISRYVAFNTIHKLSGTFEKFESDLLSKDSTIGIILGARGSGKSAFGLKLLENIETKSKKKMFAMGFKTSELPSWIKSVDMLDEIENNSYVLIDEGGILFSARQGFSDANQLLSKLLLIARHKDLSIIFISQNSANLEINAIRQADYLILKKSSLLQLDFERKKIKEIYLEVLPEFKKYGSVTGLTYIYSDGFKGFVSNPLPSFWSNKLSKSFSGKHE